MIEAIGVLLGVLGIAFAFETPRRWFTSALGIGKVPASPTRNQEDASPHPDAEHSVAPGEPSRQVPHGGLEMRPSVTTGFAPLVVTLQDGSRAIIELFVTVNVPPALAPSFIAKHGTFEQGISSMRRLVEAVARAVLEQEANISVVRNRRQRIEHDIEAQARPKVASFSVHLEAVALGEASDA